MVKQSNSTTTIPQHGATPGAAPGNDTPEFMMKPASRIFIVYLLQCITNIPQDDTSPGRRVIEKQTSKRPTEKRRNAKLRKEHCQRTNLYQSRGQIAHVNFSMKKKRAK